METKNTAWYLQKADQLNSAREKIALFRIQNHPGYADKYFSVKETIYKAVVAGLPIFSHLIFPRNKKLAETAAFIALNKMCPLGIDQFLIDQRQKAIDAMAKRNAELHNKQ